MHSPWSESPETRVVLLLPWSAPEAVEPHDPGDPVAATEHPLVGQFGMHPGRAVGAFRGLVDVADLAQHCASLASRAPGRAPRAS
jgi:hypothetical protein